MVFPSTSDPNLMPNPLPNIESYRDAPLAFRLANSAIETNSTTDGQVAYRTIVRALDGMQKEALITSSTSDAIWRLASDEGPYLNGTDLAPPPLAYFAAGMASCYADAIQLAADAAENRLVGLTIVQDNRYTMNGSAIRGTMVAGALPVNIEVNARFADTKLDANELVANAIASSPVDNLMVAALIDTFSITHNASRLAVNKVAESDTDAPASPAHLFENIAWDASIQRPVNTVSKLESTTTVFESDHGGGAAMKDQQNRELYIRSVLTLRSDGLREIRVQIFKPVGSVFKFICDVSGSQQKAPDGLALVSAGIAFCFMTQIGRYVGIAKKELGSYSIIQNTVFEARNSACMPVDTHAYLDSPESQADIQHIIDMSEQTCYLHAACRLSNATIIKLA